MKLNLLDPLLKAFRETLKISKLPQTTISTLALMLGITIAFIVLEIVTVFLMVYALLRLG